MVTICPKRPDFTSFMVHYLNKHYDASKDKALFDQTMAFLRRQYHALQASNQWEFVRYVYDFTPIEACQPQGNASAPDTEACNFVKLLSAMFSFLKDSREPQVPGAPHPPCIKPDNLIYNAVMDYIFLKCLPLGIQPTLGGLEAFFEAESYCDVTSEAKTLPESVDKLRKVLMAYSSVIPLFKPTGGYGEFSLLPLRGLDSFELNNQDEHSATNKMGSFLGHILNSGFTFTKEGIPSQRAALDYVYDDIKAKLGLSTALTTARFMNYFSYGSYENVMLQEWDNVFIRGCNYTRPGVNCHAIMPSDGCTEYCSMMRNGTRKYEDTITELYKLAVEEINALEVGSSRSLLPSCNWADDHACWSPIATDRGLCYTNYHKGIIRVHYLHFYFF